VQPHHSRSNLANTYIILSKLLSLTNSCINLKKVRFVKVYQSREHVYRLTYITADQVNVRDVLFIESVVFIQDLDLATLNHVDAENRCQTLEEQTKFLQSVHDEVHDNKCKTIKQKYLFATIQYLEELVLCLLPVYLVFITSAKPHC